MRNIEEFVSSIAGRSVMARLAASLPGLALLLAFSSAPMAQTVEQNVTFEEVGGFTPSVDLEITDQFADTTGMSFGLLGGGAPVLADVGGSREAFASVFGVDSVSGDVGQFFLTDTGSLGPCCPNLTVTFNDPVAAVSGVILDVDAGETWSILALDGEGNLLFDTTFSAGDPNTGDGSVTPWSLGDASNNGTNAIESVRLSGSGGLPGFFGFGWDNFTSTTLDEIFSDVVADSNFTADDFLDVSFDVSSFFDYNWNSNAGELPIPSLDFMELRQAEIDARSADPFRYLMMDTDLGLDPLVGDAGASPANDEGFIAWELFAAEGPAVGGGRGGSGRLVG